MFGLGATGLSKFIRDLTKKLTASDDKMIGLLKSNVLKPKKFTIIASEIEGLGTLGDSMRIFLGC